MKLKAFKAAFPYTIPVLMGYLFLGIAFGILLSSNGYHYIWAILMSVFIYAGSMQFVAVGLLTSIFDPLGTMLLTLMVNARHLFYGLSMITKFNDMGIKKFYMIFSLSDETYSLLCSTKSPKNLDKNWFYFFIALLNQSYWILGSAIGGIIGSLFTFNSKGVDFAMTALFVVIFINQWQSNTNHTPALIGVFASLLCLIIFGANNFIIPSMIAILFTLTVKNKPAKERDPQC
ncbi:branched-chain amino acid ABC transporter permease [Alkalibaculum sp. M08DMB]|uniref:Branched-chain amino acid ABC transporter permease n=1 Tax=Alkalibaculum sporogenes TaxID=2655001 RepID=A0A6A7K9C8_9FIRM|nr:AzlC family ABC transporter permease [Alkalibaculum sporogenes]MPW25713.1 branched-chain amino acid ABC transporter permease [Alkalibaculum sporogenes]